MDMNNGVNPAQSDVVRIEVYEGRNADRVTVHREPPPPYEATFDNVTVIHHPVTVTHTSADIQRKLKNSPAYYICPACDERIITKVAYSTTEKTHMLAGFICGFSCWCLLCCLAAIPYFTKTFKKAHHFCPNCNTMLGVYSLL
ncbi:lipopolysaccharide-induced tumor necrosis factor-alpha factor homolog [Helicoverpa armigera]|uniref:lipopolysaccharide-induced tumor necrosis factor-alpha factor homolog n=1 Tax=Helicoverpa armigera TaxID=29058 RepID=UPI003083914E